MHTEDSPLESTGDPGRERLIRAFRFLRDLHTLRHPVVTKLSAQQWSVSLDGLPQHPCVQLRGSAEDGAGDDTSLLVVRRPKVLKPPTLPATLEGWLEDGWRDAAVAKAKCLERRVTILEGENESEELFGDDADRVAVFEAWRAQRDSWAASQGGAHAAFKLFNSLSALYGRLVREGEALQLMLGQGLLVWERPRGVVRHPILLQRVALEFDPEVPEFVLEETQEPPELYREVFVDVQAGTAQTLRTAEDDLAAAEWDLLEEADVSGFLSRMANSVHANGRYVGPKSPIVPEAFPQIGFDACLFARWRAGGFTTALARVVSDLETEVKELPAGLTRIMGIDAGGEKERGESDGRASTAVYFTKDANAEQYQIAERLEIHGNVLVQGPPGTGKTHTIANLIGHLLATGKRVLVTAHTSKALRVLRDKVDERLRSLCVSVLDNDSESRQQLGTAVDDMVSRLGRSNPAVMERKVAELDQRRGLLQDDIAELERKLISARQGEYREVVIGGQGHRPADAARFVAEGRAEHQWIPGPLTPAAPLPLSEPECLELYATNGQLPHDDEPELVQWCPTSANLPHAQAFDDAVERWRALSSELGRGSGSEFWEGGLALATVDELNAVGRQAAATAYLLGDLEEWKLAVIAAARADAPGEAEAWRALVARVQALVDQASKSHEALLTYGPELAPCVALDAQRSIVAEIVQHLEGGKNLGFISRMLNRHWRDVLSQATVNGQPPKSVEEFRSIQAKADLVKQRWELGLRWDRQLGARGGDNWGTLGDRPEQGARLIASQIERLLEWPKVEWAGLMRKLSSCGFLWDKFVAAQSISPGDHMEVRRDLAALTLALPAALQSRTIEVELSTLDKQFRDWRRQLFPPDPQRLPARVVEDLRTALEEKDRERYGAALERLDALGRSRVVRNRRHALLEKVRASAPEWATRLEKRVGMHGAVSAPGSPRDAWKWRQMEEELDRRASLDMGALMTRIKSQKSLLQQLTAERVELQAWAAQVRRVGLTQQQALTGWKDIVRRIGRGTGKRAAGLKLEAQRTLESARSAVPVWIMPLSRVADTFHPGTSRFDVVIIDEASQCDLMGFLALYMANQAVVVGDHEQVSPSAVGQTVAQVESLIQQHLEDVPNKALYDGKASVYDFARQSFGGLIRLREHFRCVPDIIAFSNDLCYQGEVRPLRDASSAVAKRHVLEFKTKGVREDTGKLNLIEASATAALVQAMLEHSVYADKTIGVVSLLGDEQAIKIEEMVRNRIEPSLLARAQFLAGNAAQFQGDERDIVLLSLVDDSPNPPLPLRAADMYRQRFNVAASRARDQLWVVHSLDPETDLKPGDLRRRLIQHAQNPQSLAKALIVAGDRVESEFERRVAERLIREGYTVTTQYQVGGYRIDLVVSGADARLAIECDGDRHHPAEQIAEDMGRQVVLERLGWQFVRIRGTAFFRNPDAAMQPVLEALRRLGIEPEGAKEAGDDHSEDRLSEEVKRRAWELMQEFEHERI